MTDKEKILVFLEGMSKGCCPNETKEIIINKIIPWINSLSEEPVISNVNVEPIGVPAGVVELANVPDRKEYSVSKVYTFKSIPRLLEMIQPSDRAKFYATKLAERLESEGYPFDATIVKESIKIMNGEKVAMATMDEEPVSEDLEDAAYKFVMDNFGNPKEPLYKFDQRCFKAGAQWQLNRLQKQKDGK